jgi:Na+/serine symporter
MTWLDRIREWNYDLGPIWSWLQDIVQFHVERIGWPAYVGVVVVIIGIGLAIPATRGMTALVVSGVIRMIFTYVQIVVSLLTVQATGYVAKVLLSQLHRLKRWVSDHATRE